MRAFERLSSLAAVIAHSYSASAAHVVPLVGHDWTVSNVALNVSVPGSLPSQAHLDLYANQVIGDPYFGLNDFNLRWVAWNNWTYTSAPIAGLSDNATSTWILFDGLDVFTSIEFCGEHVANTDNQFRQYWFDVSRAFKSCNGADPVLSLNFGSTPMIANAIAEQSGQETWPEGVQQLYEFDNRWFVRFEQSDFGWDWGPAFAPVGPWKPAYVVQLNEDEVHIRNTLIDVYREGQLNNLPPVQTRDWVMNVSFDYFGSLPSGSSLRYNLTDLHNKTITNGLLQHMNTTNATVTGSTIIPANLVELWWPNQMGPQKLYYVHVDLVSSSNMTMESVTKRLGFRTIVLNESPISDAQLAMGIAPGNNWHFEINGHEFYAKGSNFIPPDAFWPRVTEERIDKLFDSVIDGNQNMLRVWASGAYSPDFMFDLADEKGILLWNEFEFGDALYPVNEAFLENVRQEAIYQVRRVNHHPSLAFWAGGNELENLELSLVNQSDPSQLAHYQSQYEKLFLDVLVPALFGNSRSISYAPSSTSNGWQSLNFSNSQPFTERYNNLTTGSVYGETDFYNYDPAVLYNDSALPVGRFSNEFGYHSMPSIQSWRQQVSEADLQFNSSVVTLRDHHPPAGGLNDSNYANASIGQGQMTMAVEMWYPSPNKSNSVANFSAWCWATQVFQADLYKFEIEFYRRGSGLPERQLGSLYWQLEDIWVAPTWASVEYDGRWKVLHYTAKDIYQHVIIAPYYDSATGNLTAWVTSDLWSSINGTATFEWFDWSGQRLNLSMPSSTSFEVGAVNSTQVLKANTTELLGNRNMTNAILRMSVEAKGSLPNSNQTQTFTHENWFHPTSLREAALVDPDLTVSHSNKTKTFSVRATKGVAAWVWLDYPAGPLLNFDQNAFWLAPNETREVGYTVKEDNTHGAWVTEVTVSSLWNQTQP